MPEPRRRCAQCGAGYDATVTFCPVDGTPVTARPLGADAHRYVGLKVREDVVIERLVGVGAMASVYAARQSGVERTVAVKILHRDLAQNAALVARFEREARAAARIRHPNVVEVLAAGILPELEAELGRLPYLVLEFLEGLTLRSALAAAGGALPLARTLHIVLQMADATGEAHELGIVHRDLKPENAMLVRRGDDRDFVKLLDFGLSRLAEGEAGFETQAGSVLGTARYVSPEGARGDPVGPAADVYALATVLFECLAGRTPFDAPSPVAILVQQTTERAPDIRELAGGKEVPASLADLLARCLAKDPGLRPPNGRAFGRALAGAARRAGLAHDELSPRATLFGTTGSGGLADAQRTRLLGTPSAEPTRELASDTEPLPAASRVGAEALPARPAVRTAGFVAACFALGALGALGIAAQLGSCGRSVP